MNKKGTGINQGKPLITEFRVLVGHYEFLPMIDFTKGIFQVVMLIPPQDSNASTTINFPTVRI